MLFLLEPLTAGRIQGDHGGIAALRTGIVFRASLPKCVNDAERQKQFGEQGTQPDDHAREKIVRDVMKPKGDDIKPGEDYEHDPQDHFDKILPFFSTLGNPHMRAVGADVLCKRSCGKQTDHPVTWSPLPFETDEDSLTDLVFALLKVCHENGRIRARRLNDKDFGGTAERRPHGIG